MEKLPENALVLAPRRTNLMWPGQIVCPRGTKTKERDYYDGQRYFVSFFESESMWVPKDQIRLIVKEDFNLIQATPIPLREKEKARYIKAWETMAARTKVSTPFSVTTVPIAIEEGLAVDLVTDKPIYSPEVKLEVQKQFSKRHGIDLTAIDLTAYIPVSSQGDPKIRDLILNHGIILIKDGIKPLREKELLQKTLTKQMVQIEGLEKEIKKTPDQPVEKEGPISWEDQVRLWESRWETAEDARKQAEDARKQADKARKQADKARKQADEELTILIRQYKTPLDKVFLGALIYMARDKVIECYHKDRETIPLPPLVHQADILQPGNPAIDSWLNNYFESHPVSLAEMQTLMNSKMKKKRDQISHHPHADRVIAAVERLPEGTNRDLMLRLFNFVFKQ